MVSEEGLATIEHNADTILEQVGIEFREAPDALELLKGAGCAVDAERVRFPRGLARQLVQATAPRGFDQVARNPANTVHIGGAAAVWPRHTARRSCVISTADAATARSRTSGTS